MARAPLARATALDSARPHLLDDDLISQLLRIAPPLVDPSRTADLLIDISERCFMVFVEREMSIRLSASKQRRPARVPVHNSQLQRSDAEEGVVLSLADRAYLRLRDEIITTKIPPGTLLQEGQLMARLRVGRTPIREAIQRLRRDGFVAVIPRRGSLVTEIKLTDLTAI